MRQTEDTLKERKLWFVKGEDGAAGKCLESHKESSSMFFSMNSDLSIQATKGSKYRL